MGAPTRAPVEVVSRMLGRERLGRMIRIAQTPLGLLAPLKSQQQSGGKDGGKGAGDDECNICQGNGHKGAQCPDHKAKKDRVFLSKPEASRDRVCNICRGIGQWKHHHEQAGWRDAAEAGQGTRKREGAL